MFWVVGALSVGFGVSGVWRLTPRRGRHSRPDALHDYGFSPAVARSVGVGQIIGAAGVWFYRSGVVGFIVVVGLVALAVAGVFFHIRHDRLDRAVPASVLFVLSLIVLMAGGSPSPS